MTVGPRQLGAIAAPLVLLLAPTAAMAGTRKVGIVSSPVRVARGYSLLLVAGGKDIAVTLEKTKRGSTQEYIVSGTHARTTVGGSLGSGKVDAKLGNYGSVHLRFSPGGGRSIGAPPKCRLVHPGRFVAGQLTGTLKLKIGSHRFSVSRLAAKAIKGATLNCVKPPEHPEHGLMLSQFAVPGSLGTASMAWDKNAKGRLFELATLSQGTSTDPGSLLAFIYAKAPGSALTAAKNLSSAQARAAGPYLKGSVKFAQTLPTGTANIAQGAITGGFWMDYDLLGIQQLPDPSQGILSNS